VRGSKGGGRDTNKGGKEGGKGGLSGGGDEMRNTCHI